jgi:hypothetical protein
MTEEDKKFFEDARDLFLTTGWANFKAELEVAINQIHVANCEDEKAFWMAKGRFDILSQLLGYENAVAAAEASNEEVDDASDL